MKKIFLSIVTVLIVSFSSFAQYGSSGSVDARNMSMAKTYNASASGIYSIGFNPANMMFGSNTVEFSTVFPLPSMAITGGTSFMNVNDVNYFFGGDNGKARYLTDADKSRFNNLFKDGGEVFTSLSLNLFSLMIKSSPEYGAISFAVNDFVGGRFKVPQALVDLGLNGNQFNKVYNFNDAELESSWLRDYTLSYAREIPEIDQDIFSHIAVGFSVKMVQGFYYVGVSKVNTSFLTSSNQNSISASADVITHAAFSPDFGMKYDFDSTTSNNDQHMSPFPKPAGSGLGIDFGLAASMEKWRFSASVTDMGKITWDKKPVQYTSSGDMNITDLSDQNQMDSLSDKFKSQGKYISSFSTDLPTTLRLGASYIFNDNDDYVPGNLLLALDINQGFNNVTGNTKKMRVSLGSEWMPFGGLSVRTGLSFGGIDGFNWAFGLGFNTGLVDFNFATSDMQSFTSPNSAKRISVSFGSRWTF